MSLTMLHPEVTEKRLPALASTDDEGIVFLTLNEVGTIVACDGAIEAMLGYSPADLILRHVSMLLPKLQDMKLTQGGHLSSRLHYLCHIGVPFLVRRCDDEHFLGNLLLADLSSPAERRLRLSIRRN